MRKDYYKFRNTDFLLEMLINEEIDISSSLINLKSLMVTKSMLKKKGKGEWSIRNYTITRVK